MVVAVELGAMRIPLGCGDVSIRKNSILLQLHSGIEMQRRKRRCRRMREMLKTRSSSS